MPAIPYLLPPTVPPVVSQPPSFAADGVLPVFLNTADPAAWQVSALAAPAFFAVIHSFRFATARARPHSAAWSAAMAAAVPAVQFVALGLLRLWLEATPRRPVPVGEAAGGFGFVCLLAAVGLASWWLVGEAGLGLRGRTLWTFAAVGTNLNLALQAGGLLDWQSRSMPWAFPVLVQSAGWMLAAEAAMRMAIPPADSRFAWHLQCRRCGYDLTANRSGRCPECGALVLRLR
jgi:hypothetical protein